MNKIKESKLKPFEICEYASKCLDKCNGKNVNRDNAFSCGLRRGLLISEGYKINW